jgi:hypothetical protein
MGPICNDQHPASLEWRCTCKLQINHTEKHRCYGCGFEWEYTDPQSTGSVRMQEFLNRSPTDQEGTDD